MTTLYYITFWNGKDDKPVFEDAISGNERDRWNKEVWENYGKWRKEKEGIEADWFVVEDAYSLAKVEVEI